MNFKEYDSMPEILAEISQQPLAFLYVMTDNCSVCHALKPQVEAIFEKYPDVFTMVVNTSRVPEVAGQFQLYTAPGLLLFVEGKEYLRRARMIHTQEFIEDVDKIVTSYLASVE